MKRVLPVLAALGLVLAGCGSGHEAASNVATFPRPIVDVSNTPERLVVSGTATIPHVKPGAEIACKGGDRRWMKVPAVPVAADGNSYEVDESDSGHWVKHFSDGKVTVICGKK